MRNIITLTKLLTIFAIILFSTLAQAQTTVKEEVERFEPCNNTEEAKETIVRILNRKKISISDSNGKKIKYEEAKAYDDRIELISPKGNKVFYFRYIFYLNDHDEVEFVATFEHNEYSDGMVKCTDFYSDRIRNIKDISFYYQHGFTSTTISTKYFDTHNLAEALSCIQHKLVKQYTDSINTEKVNKLNNDLAEFKETAKAYNELSDKPTITEAQRKYIVQANSFSKDTLYTKAIEAYEKAIKIDQVSYPAAYYNLALLLAEKKDLKEAINNMKKYLLLVPNAPDARAAQDKIYEWER